MNKSPLHAFDVKFDTTTKVLTIIVNFVLILTICLMANILHEEIGLLVIGVEVIVLAIICSTLILGFVYSPWKLILTNHELTIRCRAYSRHILIKDIASCTMNSEFNDYSTIRLFASGGFWGYYGLFWNSKYGKFKAFVGDRSSTFTLKLASGEIIVLGCENSKALTTELTSLINNSEG